MKKMMWALKQMMVVVIISTLIVGCQNAPKSYGEQPVVTIGKDTIYLDEMMYHLVIAKFQSKLVSSYVGDEDAYWQTKDEKGVPMKDTKKKEILEDVIKYQIYYREALAEGLSLNGEEKQQAAHTVTSIEKNIGPKAMETTQLSEEKVSYITEKIMLATKYYKEQLSQMPANETTAKTEVNKAGDRSYHIGYVFIPLQKKSDEGQIVRLSSNEKSKAYEKMQNYRIQIEKAGTLDASFDLEGKTPETTMGEITFQEADNPFGNETEIVEETKRLQIGEISPVFETNKGYYIVVCKAQGKEDTYEQLNGESATGEQEEALQKVYEQLKGNYKITVHKKVWNKIQLDKLAFEIEVNIKK